MSNIPDNLEQLVYEVLQGDLSQNPYLQPHVIASKDKSLKTQAQKVIPAINELLKRMVVCEETMQGFTTEIDKKVTEVLEQRLNQLAGELETKLEASYKEELEAKLEGLQSAIATNLTVQVKEVVNEQLSNSTGQGGSGDMKKVLVEKVPVPKGKSITITSITQEELFPENIVVYQGINLLTSGTQQTVGTSSSAYGLSFMPLAVTADEKGVITLQNRNTRSDLTVLIFKYE